MKKFLKRIFNLKKTILLSAMFIFILSMAVRIYSLNQMGRTWDEMEYIEQGYKMDELILKGEFSNKYFYTTYDHPPLVKYIYGITAHFDQKGIDKNGNPIFNYDYTYSRILSSVFASLSAVVILLMAWEYTNSFVAITSSSIFALLPFFVGLSQLVTTESILMFFFTSSVYSFLKLLQKYSFKKILLTGLLVGISLQVKQSNGLLFPLFGVFYLLWFWQVGRKQKENFFGKRFASIILILFISVLVFVAIWPMPFFHLDVVNRINQKLWMVKTSPPVIYWGKLILSPVVYFLTMFFITTPVAIIILSLLGLKFIDKKNNWILNCIILWFILPFSQSFYPWRQNGVRYIIEIYAPFSILAGLGAYYLIEKFKLGLKGKIVSFLLIVLYLFLIIIQTKPYYLDYFNELVGGAKGIYNKGYFELGWWGQGLREAGYYLRDNAKPNSKIGLFISPLHVFPPVKNLNLVYIDPNKGVYSSDDKYDYVIVNYYHVLREGFDDTKIRQNYKLIYQVKAAGAPIVDIYSKK